MNKDYSRNYYKNNKHYWQNYYKINKKRLLEEQKKRRGKEYYQQKHKRKTEKLIKIAGRDKSEKCEICKSGNKICFDHNHKTGEFRGWICSNCNLALGLINDDIKILEKMIIYLQAIP